MAKADTFDDGNETNLKWLWIALGVIALLAAAYGLYLLTGSTVGKEKKAPPTTTALLLPPPPPPPPPPPQEKPPEPVETTKPVPVENPTPAKAEAPAAIQMDSAAEAGGTIASGSGTGMGAPSSTGTGLGPVSTGGGNTARFYRQSLGNDLQDRIEQQGSLARLVFNAEVDVWVDGRGRVTKVEIARSSGDTKRDERILAALQKVTDLDPPPANIEFPARVRVGGRKTTL